MSRALSKGRKVNPLKLDFARKMRKNPTEAEALLWEALRGCRLQGWKFRRQQLMFGYIADFYCEEGDLCVEVDGSAHRNFVAEEYDRFRDAVVRAKGIAIHRVSNQDVFANLPLVLEGILKILGGPCPSRPGPRS